MRKEAAVCINENEFVACFLGRDAPQKAVALAPNEGTIQADLGVFLSDLGLHEEAVSILERAESKKAVRR